MMAKIRRNVIYNVYQFQPQRYGCSCPGHPWAFCLERLNPTNTVYNTG